MAERVQAQVFLSATEFDCSDWNLSAHDTDWELEGYTCPFDCQFSGGGSCG